MKKMKILEFNKDQVTLKMSQDDFGKMCDVLRTVAMDYNALDSELLMLTQNEVEKLRDQIFAALDEGLAQSGVNVKEIMLKMSEPKKPR